MFVKNKELYGRWKNMRQRCNNPNKRDYQYYGAKGIKVCDEWNDFKVFQEWAYENGFEPSLTIDRIDGDKDYCPSNCRFITIDEQQRNKCNNRFIEYCGETYTLSQLSRKLNIGVHVLMYGLNHGDTLGEILNRKSGVLRTSKLYEYSGKTFTISQLARMAGINTTTLEERLKMGLSIKDAVEKPFGYIVKKYDYRGKQYSMNELSEISGLTIGCINQRLLRGYSIEEALLPHPKTYKKVVNN